MKVEKTVEKIEKMEIRGASDIARATAEALKQKSKKLEANSVEDAISELGDSADRLLKSRPTAVSLPNAIRKVFNGLKETGSVEEFRELAIQNSDEFIEKSKVAKQKIGEIGSKRIKDGDKVLTHCNSEAALSIFKSAKDEGKEFEVFSTEARPRYQGRITAQDLVNEGISVTQIVDSAARFFMNEMDLVVVGADAIGANGAVANKIGTSQIALVAKEARVDFYVAAETYKFSPSTVLGELIEIEERDEEEVWENKPDDVEIRNPAFDFTPPRYVDNICTEIGLISPHMAYHVLKEEFGLGLQDVL
ncbi:ribose 1,5-bisphosphate isomerase [archaeon SCG-AAA382B04]|nr:ribose 1,5-bisphosphate isomerase [archaeon SCG-AAA382B04]